MTTLEPFHLSFVDSESPSEKIVFNVTVPLPPNQGKILNKSDPIMKSLAPVNQLLA